MTVGARDPNGIDKLPPFVDLPVAAVRSPAVRVGAKQFVRISVLVHRPIASVPGAGGVIVRDSIGGETLQFRTTDPIPELSRVVLYRRVPADGELTVTLGLAGYGDVFFDDLRIEPVVSIPPSVPQAVGRPGPPPPPRAPLGPLLGRSARAPRPHQPLIPFDALSRPDPALDLVSGAGCRYRDGRRAGSDLLGTSRTRG